MGVAAAGARIGSAGLLPDLFATTPDTRSLPAKKQGDPLPAPAPLVAPESPAAAPVTTPKSPTFSLPELETAFTDQEALMEQRQQLETQVLETNLTLSENATKKSAGVLDQSMVASDDTRRQQLEILGGIQGQIVKANEAIALSDSKNPLDKFKLYMLQQVDPSYTAEGNTARLAYLRSAADALGQQGLIQQGAYAEQIQKIQTDLGLATQAGENDLRIAQTAEAQGNERIQMAKDLQATRMGILQNQESMKQIALSQMTLDQASQAQIAAAQSDSGTANVGGVDIPLAQLNERVDALRQRDYNLKVLTTNGGKLALDELTLPQLAVFEQQALTDKSMGTTIGGYPISLAAIQERKQTLMNQDANAIATQYNALQITKSMQKEAQQNILKTMTLPELTALQSKGGIMGNVTFDMNEINNQRVLMAQAQDQQRQDMLTQMTLADPATGFVDAANALDSLKVDPASSLGQLVAKNRGLIGAAASIADPAKNPEPADLAFSANVVTLAQENVNKGITAEAKRRAGNDPALTQAYESVIRGQPIPAEVVRTALIEKVTKGLPVTEWLNGEQNGIFVSTYNAEKLRLENQAMQSGGTVDQQTIKQMAAETAVNAVKQRAASGIQDQVLATQAAIETNPLASIGHLNAMDILQVTKSADDKGLQMYIQDNRVDSKVAAEMLKGNMSPEQAGQVARYQTAALYLELEKKSPGLGKAYVKWWNSPESADMVRKYTEGKSTTFTEISGATGFSLLAPDMQGMASTYSNTLAEGERLVIQKELNAQHAEYMSFGGSPEAKQVFLLDVDKTLTDGEKQQAMQLILSPLIKQAEQAGMSPGQGMTNYIEASLRQMEPEDANQRKLVNKILKNRDASIEVLDSFIAISSDAVSKKAMVLGGPLGSVGAGMGVFGGLDTMYAENTLSSAANQATWWSNK